MPEVESPVQAAPVRDRPREAPVDDSTASALRARWELLLTLALADLRDRYGRGRWQLVKWLVDPYAAAGMYLVFIALIIDRGGEAPGLSVACAVVPFQLFLTTTVHSLATVRNRGSLILNVSFRRDLLPAAVAVTETIGFIASLSLLALMMVVYGVAPTLAILWLPAVLATTVLFALACSYPAALFGLWFRDLQTFALSAVRVFFFVAPGVVALSAIEGSASDWVLLNPLTGIFEAYRDVLLYGHAPAPWELLIPLGYSVMMLFTSVPLFRREEMHLAKVVG
jgi:lipopolysaccharide transport system permease protein